MSLNKKHIDRENYEEFFLLYIDNELSDTEKKAVDYFLSQNPDLLAELNSLKEVVLIPETSTHFNKKLLLKEDEKAINTHNYEERFLLYIDDELDTVSKSDVETFVLQHPALQNVFTGLKQSKVEAETIEFPYKNKLYKKDKKVVYMRWLFLAAAAVFIGLCYNVMIGLFAGSKNGLTKEVVTNKPTTQQEKKNEIVGIPTKNVANNSRKVVLIKHPLSVKKDGNSRFYNKGLVHQQTIQLKNLKNIDDNGIKNTSNGEVSVKVNLTEMPIELRPIKDSSALVVVQLPEKINLSTQIVEFKKDNSQSVKVENVNTGLPNNEMVKTALYKTSDIPEEHESIAICNVEISKDKLRGLFKPLSSLMVKINIKDNSKNGFLGSVLKTINRL